MPDPTGHTGSLSAVISLVSAHNRSNSCEKRTLIMYLVIDLLRQQSQLGREDKFLQIIRYVDAWAPALLRNYAKIIQGKVEEALERISIIKDKIEFVTYMINKFYETIKELRLTADTMTKLGSDVGKRLTEVQDILGKMDNFVEMFYPGFAELNKAKEKLTYSLVKLDLFRHFILFNYCQGASLLSEGMQNRDATLQKIVNMLSKVERDLDEFTPPIESPYAPAIELKL